MDKENKSWGENAPGTSIFGNILPDSQVADIPDLPRATNKNIEIIKLLSLLSTFSKNFPEGIVLNEFILID
jgi:hypothetical protein